MNRKHIGRFAPSPSGHLHYGSLLAAVASFLNIRSKCGLWLVRIDDLDPPREVPGSSDEILRTLEQYGLHWDKEVTYQSQRNNLYKAALQRLYNDDHLYHCNCSRKEIALRGETVYKGFCYTRNNLEGRHTALRVNSTHNTITWKDLLQGQQSFNLAETTGDFIVRRADKLYAYHLAAAVDDFDQSITEVIRGADLLSSTPAQIFLQQALGYNSPDYGHIPVAVNNKGEKLSKQCGAEAVSELDPGKTLHSALADLGQQPPAELMNYSVQDILEWGIANWCLQQVSKAPKGINPAGAAPQAR